LPAARTRGPGLTKTNNSHHKVKVELRADAIRGLGKDRVRVLDAFAGDSLIWESVAKELPDVSFDVLKIDKKPYSDPKIIVGDNRKVMPSLDLAEFDLIDLDAWGIPQDQLRLCAERAPGVPVAVTCIMFALTPIPRLAHAAGIPKDWTDHKKYGLMLYSRWQQKFWDNYCATLGYTRTTRHIYRQQALKMYQILW
jgi:hypothetical protein